MASYVIFAHGGRDAGTTGGTYVLPPGTTVYFFEKDTQFLYVSAARTLMHNLLKAHPAEAAVRALAQETKTQWETIPNYVASGDPNMPDMGVYKVGEPMATGCVQTIANGSSYRISSLIGGQGAGAIGNHVYWFACRDAPQNSNNFAYETASTFNAGGQALDLNAKLVSPTTGLTPSQVKATGNWR